MLNCVSFWDIEYLTDLCSHISVGTGGGNGSGSRGTSS